MSMILCIGPCISCNPSCCVHVYTAICQFRLVVCHLSLCTCTHYCHSSGIVAARLSSILIYTHHHHQSHPPTQQKQHGRLPILRARVRRQRLPRLWRPHWRDTRDPLALDAHGFRYVCICMILLGVVGLVCLCMYAIHAQQPIPFPPTHKHTPPHPPPPPKKNNEQAPAWASPPARSWTTLPAYNSGRGGSSRPRPRRTTGGPAGALVGCGVCYPPGSVSVLPAHMTYVSINTDACTLN